MKHRTAKEILEDEGDNSRKDISIPANQERFR
jgi:hypothetical protein